MYFQQIFLIIYQLHKGPCCRFGGITKWKSCNILPMKMFCLLSDIIFLKINNFYDLFSLAQCILDKFDFGVLITTYMLHLGR